MLQQTNIASGRDEAIDAEGAPLRILQFVTNFYKGGGIQTHVLELSKWLEEHGHQIWYAAEPRRSSYDTGAENFIPLSMADVAKVDGNLPSRVFAMLRNAMRLRKAIAKHKFDVIHVHETAPALVARLATIGRNIPIVMTFHGSAPERIPSAARIGQYCADLVASPSRISLDALIANGVRADKTKVLRLGIKPLRAVTEDTISKLKARYKKDGAGHIVFSPSRLAPQKGIDVMIEVAKRVIEQMPDTQFVVAGGGVLTGTVNAWAMAAGVDKNMHFLGAIDTVPEHLRASDLFLLTSRWEALPISIVESFRAGLPVVATDCGGVSELVDDQVGALCEVEDVDGLANAVLSLLQSKTLRERKSAGALERSREDRFDVEFVHSEFEATYRDIVKRGPA
ncbi:MAG: glycosyltransferase family 4 protein [Hyphomonas sp.]|nr:glycosyltransferase family 4 protein [Hyphomonas sp.]